MPHENFVLKNSTIMPAVSIMDRLLCAALPGLALLPPLFERLRGYDSPETLALAAAFLPAVILPLAALGYWLSKGRWPWLLSLFVAAMVVGYFDVAFEGTRLLNQAVPSAAELSRVPLMFSQLAAFAAVSAVLAVLVRIRMQDAVRIAALAFGVVAASSVVLSEQSGLAGFDRDAPRGVDGVTGPKHRIVVLFDEMIGSGGLDTTLEGAPALREEIVGFYRDNGFRNYPNAYSLYSTTSLAVPSILNGTVGGPTEVSEDTISRVGGGLTLLRNAFFERMAAEGRVIHVFQSPFIDYCTEAKVTRCRTLNSYDYFNDYVDPEANVPLGMVGFIAVKHASQDSILLRYPTLAAHKILTRLFRDRLVPDSAHYSPISFSAFFDAFVADIVASETGSAHFGHFLVPHSPHVLDAQCNVVGAWPGLSRELAEHQGLRGAVLERHRAEHYKRYFAQLQCAYRKLNGLVSALRAAGKLDDSEIVILSDHGSRISGALSLHEMQPRDFKDNYSTTFAIRTPGLAGGTVTDQVSVQEIFAGYVLGDSAGTSKTPWMRVYASSADAEEGWQSVELPEF